MGFDGPFRAYLQGGQLGGDSGSAFAFQARQLKDRVFVIGHGVILQPLHAAGSGERKMVKKSKTLHGEVLSPERGDDDEPDKGGQPPHTPTQQLRDNVEVLAGRKVRHTAIAALIGVSAPTLRKHYSRELIIGDAKVQALVGESILTNARGAPAEYYPPGHVNAGKLARAEIPPNPSLLKFLGRTVLGLRESVDLNLNDRRDFDPANSDVAGLTNTERRQEIEALLRIADLRKKKAAPAKPPPMGSNGSDKVH
jgi:hypothetical protein